ncbi:endoribonuclease l-psp [Heliomicrobium modesticaldum Ice1]|uniref:Endoribonuclease l-psp n=1 Tax=Heliobacterium modesticaldum (strain ATCC 51547 / Ice1) TaxID=498761 RepID=B0TBZ9_HELMI|nr:RidA family protein [Heliomicrobium modesticaldum]ABZ85272.1 endoribonuclease l-psp [Heliomicrobium modesticaldum Ice1]
MSVEAKLQELGLTLPEAPKPVAAYVPSVKAGDFVYTSGQIPFVNGELKYKGKVGKDLTPEKAYEAAKVCCLNCLGVIKGQVGDLNQVKKIVKVTGFVNSAPGFQGQPGVINGASELLGQVFGDKGQHARSAVGVNELPLDAAVEVEMIVQV